MDLKCVCVIWLQSLCSQAAELVVAAANFCALAMPKSRATAKQRAPNAFQLWMREEGASVPSEPGKKRLTHLAQVWKMLDPDKKEEFQSRAKDKADSLQQIFSSAQKERMLKKTFVKEETMVPVTYALEAGMERRFSFAQVMREDGPADMHVTPPNLSWAQFQAIQAEKSVTSS